MNVKIKNLGITKYQDTWLAMKNFISSNPDHDEIWITEHYPIYTVGLNKKGLVLPKNKDIEFLYVDRGGKITYHGPGQLVAYTLFDIKRLGVGVRQLVTTIEQSIVQLLTSYGVDAQPDRKAPGVYVAGKKIAALGLRVRKGCAYHGLSLNVEMDLDVFSLINPCGYAGLEVTQTKDQGIDATMPELAIELTEHITGLFGYDAAELN